MLSYLASLSSLAAGAGAISSALQRRLLLYLVKRVLGHFVQDRDLKPEQIEAGIGSGHVEIRNVRLDTNAISTHLPCRATHGIVGSIVIDVPWSNLYSGQLSVKVTGAHIDLALAQPLHGFAAGHASLQESIYSAAEEVLEQDEEGKDLEQSIAEELPAAATQDSSQNSIAARIVNGLLARLTVSITETCLRIHDENDECSLDVHIANVSIGASEATETVASEESVSVRTAVVTGAAIWISQSNTQATHATGEEDDDDDDDDDGDEMEASTADLRESMRASLYSLAPSMRESMYASAVSHEDDNADVKPAPEILCARLDDPVRMQLKIAPESAVPHTSVEIEIGNGLVLLDADSMALLLRFGESFSRLLHAYSTPSKAAAVPDNGALARSITISANLRSFQLLALYESTHNLSAAERSKSDASIHAFWSRPAKSRPLLGHLRLRLNAVKLQKLSRGLDVQTLVDVCDVSLFEAPSKMESPRKDAIDYLPVIVLDANLEAASPQDKSSEASLAVYDWRMIDLDAMEKGKPAPYRRFDGSEYGWKTKSSHRRASSSTASSSSMQVANGISLSYMASGTKSLVLDVIPIHAFADLSLVDRVIPMLKSINRKSKPHTFSSSTSDMTASIETLQAASSIDSVQFDDLPAPVSQRIACPLIRVELRVPSDHSDKGKLCGRSLRSGIIVAEVSLLSASLYSQVEGQTTSHPGLTSQHSAAHSEVTFESVDLYFCPARANVANFVASISHLTADAGEVPRPPRIELCLSPEQGATKTRKTSQSTYNGRIPLIRAALTKPLLDGLELVIDDLSMWMSALDSNKNNAGEGTSDTLRILGSRFFGSRSTVLSADSASTELVLRPERTPLFGMSIDEVSLVLVIPNRKAAPLSKSDGKKLQLHMSDLRLDINSQQDLHFTKASLSIGTLELFHESSSTARQDLITRTLLPSPAQGSQPVVSVHLTSTRDPYSSFRSSQVEVDIQNLTLTYDGNASFLRDLIVFGRSPEGAFQNVEPTEQTTVTLKFRDISLLLAPAGTSARAVVVLEMLSMRAAFVSHHPKTSLKFRLLDGHMYASEELETPSASKLARCRRPEELWKRYGMYQLVHAQELHATILLSQFTRPEMEVKVSRSILDITACADSLYSLEVVIAAAKNARPTSVKHEFVKESRTEIDQSLLTSLDDDAFKASLAPRDDTDLLEDDIPKHPSYWNSEEAKSHRSVAAEAAAQEDEIFPGNQPMAASTSSIAKNDESSILLQTDVVTVRLADRKRPLRPTIGYFCNPDLMLDSEDASPSYASSMRMSLRRCDLNIRLHGGYDNQTCRDALREEARRVRRRLQKIKQMLDKGQQPDDSVEEATASLMDSMHIPMPAGADLDAAEMMQLMDDELGDQSETASSASTWKQFVPTARPTSQASITSTNTKRSKLERSSKSMIDIELHGIKLDYDRYVSQNPLAARALATVKSIRIHDNIKTSTWHTFLTGIASEHNPMPQYSRDMLKIELKYFEEDEVRVKAKIAPLRLHVDQDALDFLKKFFTFEYPHRKGEIAERVHHPDPKPFIQHAEIFPIRLKLDYKPKRVDYRLLRQGKTIEMMNFFNFEESDIVLRHITLRGISGWPKLFELLNDMWTPDVKSNQLADVLSGIAPIRSLVNVGNGVADLILLPIEQYQRDGRLGKGLRDGATRFVKSTALEAARIGARLATGTQVILEQAEKMLGGNSMTESVVIDDRTSSQSLSQRQARVINEMNESDSDEETLSDDERVRPRYSRYVNQPTNLRAALDDAQRGLSRGFNEAAQTILAVPMEVYDRSSGEGGKKPVVRAVPIAVLKGAAGASEALTKALQGVQRELGGADRAEQEEKYKRPGRGGASRGSPLSPSSGRRQ